MKKWRQLGSQIVFDTPYFNIRKDVCQLPDGREIDDYYVLQSTDIVLIVARTVNEEFVLVEQYKHGFGTICTELPGGLCEADSPNALEDAQRELREETGYVADEWQLLGRFITSPTRSSTSTSIYLALDAYRVGEQNLDPNEDITVHLLPQAEVMPMIRTGQINVPDSIAGLMLALDWLGGRR